ncbi:MAG: class I SAM-dependent DNA methyltransferase [Candidatus Promineifilaceae bacterium]
MSEQDYVDFAEYYDLDHALTFDLDFYLDYARQTGSPILDLACGTGRVLIPLAEAGYELHGVDISANMLAVCRGAVQAQSLAHRVILTEADMAAFDLPRKEFAMALVALRSFMHLLTCERQQSCLRSLHEHLRPGGMLVINIIAPDPRRLALEPGESFAVAREFDLPNGNHVLRKQRLAEHDRRSQVRRFEFLFEEFDADGRLVTSRIVPLQTRYIFYDEMIDLLESTGFQIIDVFRDYDKNAYDGTGEMIVVAQRAET